MSHHQQEPALNIMTESMNLDIAQRCRSSQTYEWRRSTAGQRRCKKQETDLRRRWQPPLVLVLALGALERLQSISATMATKTPCMFAHLVVALHACLLACLSLYMENIFYISSTYILVQYTQHTTNATKLGITSSTRRLTHTKIIATLTATASTAAVSPHIAAQDAAP
jgi:hypothetical protein